MICTASSIVSTVSNTKSPYKSPIVTSVSNVESNT